MENRGWRMEDGEQRTENREQRTENTEYRMQNTEYRIQNTEYRIQLRELLQMILGSTCQACACRGRMQSSIGGGYVNAWILADGQKLLLVGEKGKKK